MAAATKKTRIKFSMNTGVFCEIWRNHISHPGADNWEKFVLNCFERFSGSGSKSNIATLTSVDAAWKKWNKEKQYEFLSERAYAKCINIQRKLRQEENLNIDLPDGYKQRKGKTTTRLTTGQLADIFRS